MTENVRTQLKFNRERLEVQNVGNFTKNNNNNTLVCNLKLTEKRWKFKHVGDLKEKTLEFDLKLTEKCWKLKNVRNLTKHVAENVEN